MNTVPSTPPDILAHAQQAIQQERERRDYHVIVALPRRTTSIADMHIPSR